MNIYTDRNRELWNYFAERDFKSLDKVVSESSITQLEKSLLGHIENKSILHLQCYLGMSSLWMAKQGAKVTGIDISDTAIKSAQRLAKQNSLEATFIQSDVYHLDRVLDKKFDIVFTSFGVLSWLHNLNLWGGIVSHFLKQGGTFILTEFHPFANMFADDGETIEYPYFSHSKPLTFMNKLNGNEFPQYNWTWNLSDVINTLLKNGLQITEMNEYPYSVHNCYSFLHCEQEEMFTHKKANVDHPLMYSIVAKKLSFELT